ncbi:hypothetical protein [Pseudoalteromonas sp. SWYJZ98]|uniref:hypothetical protein n=1 Tax=Pseudoalteromonas sp. SWYJZ98 TaxID=2792060 RepID=UPI003FA6E07D
MCYLKYRLTINAAGRSPVLEIDEEKFNSIVTALNQLSAAMAIEEKYELLIGNYLDLEKEVLNVTAEDILYSSSEYSGFFDIRLACNKRIVNLLTSTKLYIDQIQQHTKICVPDSSSKVKAFFSKEYDENFEYRFMEALRNYVQHRGLAVHATKHGSRWLPPEENRLMECGTKIFSHKSELENDKAFKKAVVNEMNGNVELISTTRKYVESINYVHIQIRGLIEESVKNSRELIEGVISSYEDSNNGHSLGLCATAYESGEPIDTIIKRVQVFLDWDNVRIKLESKNRKLTNLSRRYVTGNCL